MPLTLRTATAPGRAPDDSPFVFALFVSASVDHASFPRNLGFSPFSANPFTNIRRTVAVSRVNCLEIRQESNCLSIDEPNIVQIENDGLLVLFKESFSLP